MPLSIDWKSKYEVITIMYVTCPLHLELPSFFSATCGSNSRASGDQDFVIKGFIYDSYL